MPSKKSPDLNTSQSVYRFSGYLEPLANTLAYFGLIIPEEIIETLPKHKRIRVKGTINGFEFALAIQYLKTGFRYFMISKTLRNQAKISLSQLINVEFYLVDGNIVDLPDELIEVLQQDEEGNKIWQTFTPGLQRSLTHYILSTKNVDLRIKRSIYLLNKAKNGDYSKK